MNGVLLLHEPAEGAIKADVVFVHGLTGDRTTWANEEGVLWPQSWLPKDLEVTFTVTITNE